MEELEFLESKYKFTYPPIYRQLCKDGMLDWFRGWNEPWTATRNWFTEIYPTLLDNPPLLLHSRDFELFEFKDIDNRLSDIPDHWDPQFKFIPFAMNGAGDWYAFYINSPLENTTPVIFAPHDEENATYLAKDMDDFIFRMMLEYAAEIDEEQLEDEEQFHENILAMLKSHERYLASDQTNMLKEVYNRTITEYKYGLNLRNPYTAKGLLGEEELDNILKEQIGFDKLNKEFKYML